MDDLTICKKIAEIESTGVYWMVDDFQGEGYYFKSTPSGLGPVKYNPLTNDALCFQLMVKYKVKMSCLWEENDGTPHYEAYINEDSSDAQCEKLPNKAICLAIIKAHKESNNG